ncbi:MAG: glycosyltransferase family 2 protein [Bacillati bacterium ANGP1]|uniref:Glycosyltransferase family 2 protein n=1 Tax=Candidatus Segetimicrobium genomatis TaxID=2569760 RepID=A0A537KTI5_9BACT|nr:MAG: glycosyltransferase family 2 protein [Terrabacteria group bacterium ANGP1]
MGALAPPPSAHDAAAEPHRGGIPGRRSQSRPGRPRLPRPGEGCLQMTKVSVILPTYNEAGNIIDLVNAIIQQIPRDYDYEIIVVDDNSPDNTHGLVRETFQANPKVVPVLRTVDRGFAKSIREGIERAGGDRIVVMDTDFTHDPAEIPRLLHVLPGRQHAGRQALHRQHALQLDSTGRVEDTGPGQPGRVFHHPESRHPAPPPGRDLLRVRRIFLPPHSPWAAARDVHCRDPRGVSNPKGGDEQVEFWEVPIHVHGGRNQADARAHEGEKGSPALIWLTWSLADRAGSGRQTRTIRGYPTGSSPPILLRARGRTAVPRPGSWLP